MTTCQICGRAIQAKKGLIAHHGYRRPGSGWQTASCLGARCLPYEVSCGAIAGVIKQMEAQVDRTRDALDAFIASPPASLLWARRDAYGRTVRSREVARPDDFDADRGDDYRGDSYRHLYHCHVRDTRQNLAGMIEFIAFLQQRLDDWRPAEAA